ncbi:sigma-54-dependent transcriptional regulator [Desulfogranum marinum]|uniref:sigma-54-dependent transcriptional regulator n=1 Tax=Desulfogranum marinum TaxID=453220 RepID=UPI001964DB87|nr:sigma-54 dependent transcriptional regulator [Desulfogranum marinum]MBM9513570.1 sigma-54-dependent Fis family transcriptional regulator [Desulfogranum marinum]
MKNPLHKLLIIDDEANMRHMLAALLKRHGYAICEAGDGRQGIQLLQEHPFDFVLCDVRMPEMDGLTFLQEAREVSLSATIIMMSAYGSVEDAVQAMKLGAYDYIAKPFKEDEILLVLEKAGERSRLIEENKNLKKKIALVEASKGFASMVGKSPAMQGVFELATKVAPYNTTVLITGESGTGKELVARGIHQLSHRKDGPFIAVNCGAIPENLLESELYGYVKGAFTGAVSDKPGLFEEAAAGTLFLDEIGELPLAMQVKLLRVLQEHEIRRIGSSRSRDVDVRVIAATARNLEHMVTEKRFREDLFYRLNVVNVCLPPLRERRDDLPLLCDHFIRKMNHRMGKQVTDIVPKAMELVMRHDWPGNVRELENVIERAVILAEKTAILPENLPERFGAISRNRRINDFLGTYSLKKAKMIMEEKLIARSMEASGGNKSKAAKMLEISYPSLLSKLKRYNLHERKYR